MKLFCDSEFTGLRKDTEIISIGIVDENGRTFYAEANDYSIENLHDDDKKWLSENVISHLLYNNETETFVTGNLNDDLKIVNDKFEYTMKGSKDQIRIILSKWLEKYDSIIFVGDVLAYDWVLFCDLLSERAIDLPKNISYTPLDIATLMYVCDLDPLDITREKFIDVCSLKEGKIWQNTHNALFDALVIKMIYYKLMEQIKIKSVEINNKRG